MVCRRKLYSFLLLLTVFIDKHNHAIEGLSTATTTAKRSRKVNNKKPLPESELLNRHKNPALWREDLTVNSNDESSTSIVNSDDTERIRRLLKNGPPEIMSPVGGWPQLRAAVGNGADSVYIGLKSYSARARATNFDPYDGELDDVVSFCHASNVKVYVAINTLVFDKELDEVEGLISVIDKSNVDAVIVQDIGITKLIQRVAPNLEIHASTQQSITSADGASYASETCNANRVVVGRELSITEIESITDQFTSSETEIETFVHGALCVSYSGQCFSSEFIGGRSANRGQCAQACRLPYGLIVDGDLRDLQDMKYLLSPQDLCGLDQVPSLVRAGVSCLKIEGRLKDEAYVASTTRAYRNAVDKAWNDLISESSNKKDSNYKTDNDQQVMGDSTKKQLKKQLDSYEEVTKAELAQLFSRGQDENYDGLSVGFFDGPKHQNLVRGRSPRHRGIHIGRVEKGSSPQNGLVVSVDHNSNEVEKLQNLKPGDGIVIDRGDAQDEELGGPIYDIEKKKMKRKDDGETVFVATIWFGRDVQRKWKKLDDMSKRAGRKLMAPFGSHIWKTSDATVDKKMRKLSEAPPPRNFVSIDITGNINEPLIIKVKDLTTGCVGIGTTSNSNHGGSDGDSGGVLVQADKRGLTNESLYKAIGKLGNTNYATRSEGDLNTAFLDESNNPLWCPVSWIKDARRKAIEDLDEKNSLLRSKKNNNNNHAAENGSFDLGPATMIAEQDYSKFNVVELKEKCHELGLRVSGKKSVLIERIQENEFAKSEENNSIDVKEESSSIARKVLHEATTKVIDGDSASSSSSTNVKTEEDTEKGTTTRLSVLARTYDQVDAICQMVEEADEDGTVIVDEVIIDFLEVDGMKEAATRVRQTKVGNENKLKVIIASPRIIKPGEAGIWRTLLRLQPDGLLVRSTGLLYRMMKLGGTGSVVNIGTSKQKQLVPIPDLIGDFSLNAANALTALEYLSGGLTRITASLDLNARSITNLAKLVGPAVASSHLEVIVHTHMPTFHTEHCVFARFLSNGNSYVDCGHACTRHNVHLRDENGNDNLVLADMGCRNTVFSAQAQSGVHSIDEWVNSAGIGRLRIELVDEGSHDTKAIIASYLSVLSGEARPSNVWESLKDIRDSNGRCSGVSHGSLRNDVERRAGQL